MQRPRQVWVGRQAQGRDTTALATIGAASPNRLVATLAAGLRLVRRGLKAHLGPGAASAGATTSAVEPRKIVAARREDPDRDAPQRYMIPAPVVEWRHDRLDFRRPC